MQDESRSAKKLVMLKLNENELKKKKRPTKSDGKKRQWKLNKSKR